MKRSKFKVQSWGRSQICRVRNAYHRTKFEAGTEARPTGGIRRWGGRLWPPPDQLSVGRALPAIIMISTFHVLWVGQRPMRNCLEKVLMGILLTLNLEP